jgi:hypothetical protein
MYKIATLIPSIKFLSHSNSGIFPLTSSIVLLVILKLYPEIIKPKIIEIIAIVLFIILFLNAGLIIRWRIFVGKYPTKKVYLWSNIILFIMFVLYGILPKSNGECKVNIFINNKNSISEIIIDRKYTYYLTEDEKIKLDNLKSSGFIAIKTQNDAFIGAYHDDSHLFKVKHIIKIEIIDNNISISTAFPKLSIGTIINDIEKYGNVIELFK